jgi:hypothetical protein
MLWVAKTALLRGTRGGSGNPNAFGTLLFTGGGGGNPPSSPDYTIDLNTASPPLGAAFEVFVGDVIIVATCEDQTGISVTAVSDNLGNTYSASNVGTSGSSMAARMFYTIVTVPGIVSSITVTHNHNSRAGASVAAFAGPCSAVDANPSNNTDGTSPHVCPLTGTLAQSVELVIGWGAAEVSSGANTSLDGVTTGTMAIHASSGTLDFSIASIVTSTTSSTSVTFTSTDAPSGGAVLGTTSFKRL